jgi:hypothetical protein
VVEEKVVDVEGNSVEKNGHDPVCTEKRDFYSEFFKFREKIWKFLPS